jgi:hypothetical protein
MRTLLAELIHRLLDKPAASPSTALSSSTDNAVSEALQSLYAAATQQWMHAEQMRWTVLYNFLVGNTILLVAWSTLFAQLVSSPWSIGLRIVVIGFCPIGMLGGILWAFLQARSNTFAKHYFGAAFELEKALCRSLDGARGACAIADEHRRAGVINTHRVVVAVPAVFAAVYLGLLLVSIYAAVGRI